MAKSNANPKLTQAQFHAVTAFIHAQMFGTKKAQKAARATLVEMGVDCPALLAYINSAQAAYQIHCPGV